MVNPTRNIGRPNLSQPAKGKNPSRTPFNFKLDPRPVPVWSEPRVRYFQLICHSFNLNWPNGQEQGKVVFIPAAGTDLTTIFEVTDPEVAIMVERNTLAYQYGVSRPGVTQEDVLRERYQNGFRLGPSISLRGEYTEFGYVRDRFFNKEYEDELIYALIREFRGLGLREDDWKIHFPPPGENKRNYIKICFPWNYVGRKAKPRIIYYLYSTRSTDEAKFPGEVVELIKQRGLDVILQKGSMNAGITNEEALVANLVPRLVLDNVKRNGLFLTEVPLQLAAFRTLLDADPRIAGIREMENIMIPQLLRPEDLDPNANFGLFGRRGIWGYSAHVQVLEKNI